VADPRTVTLPRSRPARLRLHVATRAFEFNEEFNVLKVGISRWGDPRELTTIGLQGYFRPGICGGVAAVGRPLSGLPGGRGAPTFDLRCLGPPRPSGKLNWSSISRARHGMPYDAERVAQLRRMLREARKRKLSERLAIKRGRSLNDER
jgi:hypothetical protein